VGVPVVVGVVVIISLAVVVPVIKSNSNKSCNIGCNSRLCFGNIRDRKPINAENTTAVAISKELAVLLVLTMVLLELAFDVFVSIILKMNLTNNEQRWEQKLLTLSCLKGLRSQLDLRVTVSCMFAGLRLCMQN